MLGLYKHLVSKMSFQGQKDQIPQCMQLGHAPIKGTAQRGSWFRKTVFGFLNLQKWII